jgi:hypothetical protein
VIAAAAKKSKEIGQPMNIAVADEGGNLVSHVRMDTATVDGEAFFESLRQPEDELFKGRPPEMNSPS